MNISKKSGSSVELQVELGVAPSTQRGAIGSVVRFLGAAAVDATVVALLTVAVVFAASSSSIASPKAWFYAGSGGYGNNYDTDGDGVTDAQDSCPWVAGSASCNGCPAELCATSQVVDEIAEAQQLGCYSYGYGSNIEENKFFAAPAAVSESVVQITLRLRSCQGLSRAQLYSPDNSLLGELSANYDCTTYEAIAAVSAADFNGWVAAGQSFRVGTATDRLCGMQAPEVSLRFQFQGIELPLSGDDFDGDGVSNGQDRCPTVQGTCDGCPAGDAVDTDSDGTPNCQDPDDDDDGVLDSADRCPLAVGDAACLGCPSDMCSEPSVADRDLGKNYLPSDYLGYGNAVYDSTQYFGVSGSRRAAGDVQLVLYANPGDDGWYDSYVHVDLHDSFENRYGNVEFWGSCGEQELSLASFTMPLTRFNALLDAGGQLRLVVTNRSAGCSPYVGVRVRYSGYVVPAAGSDGDGDLIPIEFDRCPTAAGTAICRGCPPELCADFDNDGIPDDIDTDDDDDDYPDANDAFPRDASEWADADGDGTGDNADTDDDNDLVDDVDDGCPLDALKQSPGGCGCGVPDVDSDGDGVLDCLDGCPTDARKVVPGECGCGGFEEDVDGDGDVDCALPSGTVRAWGSNGQGQTTVPSDLGASMSIAAGGYHTVALRTDGTVRAWGFNGYGQTNVPSDLGASMAIAAGEYHTVALRTDGTVRAWGYNDYGQTNVPSDLGASMAIAASGSHTVAISNLDCNANGIPDWRELSLNDIDRDGRLDVCEVDDGAADCNGDLVPDDDQLPVLRERSISGQFAPAGQSRQFPVPVVREASPGTTVEISGVANGDLSGSGEFLRIAVAGAEMELAGTKWGASASVTVSAAAFNEALALNRGGSLPLRVTSGANVDSYNGDSFTVTLRYWSGTLTDCNLNGQPDSCDLSPGLQTDCDLNGVPDNCDVGASPTVETAYGQTCDGQTANFSAHVVTRAVLGSTVTVDVEARGDTDRGAAFGEFVEVRFGNRTVVHQGVACGESGNYQVQMDAAEFNALIDANDDVALSITAGPDAECTQCQSTATVRFTFVGVDPANDCNINGLPDTCDISSGYSTDSDGDGIPNECDGPDLDSDGDGVIDAVDACPQVAGDAACNGCPRNVCGQCGTDGLVDTDGDTEFDCVDTDDDGDGVIDALDAFPLDAGETADTDGDGQGNNADTDDDQDGLDDGADNCPGTVNIDQADLDADGAGDACDLDDDNDGAVDTVDNCPTLPNPTQGDCDGNGIGDACDTASTSAGPDMVVNGGFEASEYNGTFVGDCFTSGGFTMAGWQHGATRTEDLYRNNDGGQCFATPANPLGGQYLLSLQGSGCCNCNVNGAIWQELVTETDRTYTLRMQVFVDDFDAIRVSYGTQSATFSSANVAAEVWTEVTWQFNGVGQAAELRIQSVGSVTAPGCLEADNAFLDNVRVTRDAVVVDCNDNGQQDLLEIAAGTVADCNSNCVPDSCEPDADGDGFIDACDPCPGKPGPECNGCPRNECGECGSPADLDGDGVPDCVDEDDDGDNVPDAVDAFPMNSSETVDTDGDGVGNNADTDDDGDGIADDGDNCDEIQNPMQEDCNGNSVGDACELAADPLLDCNLNGALDSCDVSDGASDCDADGVLDSCELASGAGDCNGNGIPDSCDIAAYRLEDCNVNGIGDSCEKQLQLDLSSGIQAPLGFGFPKVWTLEKVVRAVDTVRVELTAKGDLSSMLEYVQVDFPQSSYRAFNDSEGDAPDCVVTSVDFEIPLELFNNSIAPDGSMRITLTPSAAVDRLFCGGDTWIEVSVIYIGAASSDCNANGVLDSCEIAAGTQADSDGNGIPDECVDPILPCPADFDGNGLVNGADLGALLSDWGGTNPYYDVNRDGLINGADLGELLALWGVCSE